MYFCLNCQSKLKSDQILFEKCKLFLSKNPRPKIKISDWCSNRLFMLREYSYRFTPAHNKRRQTWVVYQNGNICSIAYYRSCGKTSIIHSKLKDSELRKLNILCDSLAESKPSRKIVYDGVGYTLTVYNADGTEKWNYSGYIDGIKLMEAIRDVILNIPGLDFPNYMPPNISIVEIEEMLHASRFMGVINKILEGRK